MLIVVLIASGLCMFTYKSTQFNMLGFFFLLLASITSAIRWTFAQFIMQKSKLGLHNPIDMIYFMQPWMIFPLLPLSIGFEGVNSANNFSQNNCVLCFVFFCLGFWKCKLFFYWNRWSIVEIIWWNQHRYSITKRYFLSIEDYMRCIYSVRHGDKRIFIIVAYIELDTSHFKHI